MFADRLASCARHVEERLDEILKIERAGGSPQRLVEAMRHGVLGGGKRFRPFLVLESAGLFGIEPRAAVDAAAALECIHCYSLIHDDLPAMDNDTLRRGVPTVWKAFGEWTAILAGDALQSLAFELLSGERCHADPLIRSSLVQTLALAAGAPGMVGGQALDLEAETLMPAQAADVAHVARLQAMKTGRLIRAACDMGATLGKASDDDRNALNRYGEALGFAFQISDDLLDAEGHADIVGKATGKDVAAGKATLVSLLGITSARDHMEATVNAAIVALEPFGSRAEILKDAARFMGRRGV